ncbi:MAG: alanine racemase [Burkholderiales bacterium]
MPRPLRAHIHLAALRHNLARVRRAAPKARVLAVIKANGYGHGMLDVARALQDADGFAVLEIEEAKLLRAVGFRQDIVLLEGPFNGADLAGAERYRLSIVVHAREQLDMIESATRASKIDVFLKLNSGMNRLGFAPGYLRPALARLAACPNVGCITLMTHFANADVCAGVASQMACFQTLTEGLALPTSLANSAAVLRYPETHGDWIRPGLMLYGGSPFADTDSAALELRPAMTLQSEIIGLQQLQPGQRVGYGGCFEAVEAMRVAVVACGYGDGYPRHAPTGTPVRVEGQPSRLLGTVSMDMLCVDITHLPQAGVGSTVTLWGEGLPVEEVARCARTVNYELLCGLTQRVRLAASD